MAQKIINSGSAPILWSNVDRAFRDINENFTEIFIEIENVTVRAVNWDAILNKPTFSTVAFSGSFDDLTDTPSIPSDLNQLTDADNLLDVVGLESRLTAAGTTISLDNLTAADLTISGYKGYLLYKIETDAAAWVRLYTDSAARTSDNSRPLDQDPINVSGLIAEVLTTGNEIVNIAPGVIGFNNDDPVSDNVYLRVQNQSGSTQDITVTLTLVQLEA